MVCEIIKRLNIDGGCICSLFIYVLTIGIVYTRFKFWKIAIISILIIRHLTYYQYGKWRFTLRAKN